MSSTYRRLRNIEALNAMTPERREEAFAEMCDGCPSDCPWWIGPRDCASDRLDVVVEAYAEEEASHTDLRPPARYVDSQGRVYEARHGLGGDIDALLAPVEETAEEGSDAA